MLYSLLTNILTLIMAILGTIGAVWRYLVEVAFTRGMNWRSVRKKTGWPFLALSHTILLPQVLV